MLGHFHLVYNSPVMSYIPPKHKVIWVKIAEAWPTTSSSVGEKSTFQPKMVISYFWGELVSPAVSTHSNELKSKQLKDGMSCPS